MTLEQSFLPIPATSRSSFAPILNGTIQTKWSTANALKRIAILHSRTHFYLHLLSKVAKCSRVCWVLVIPELFGNQKTGLRMLRRETLVLTRALNTFSPLLSTSAMHRPRSSSRSNAAFRSRSSGSAAASSRGPAADVAACCLLADRRFARDIHRIRSATHQIRGMEDEEDLVVVTTACLGVADGALNLAGEDIQHGVASTSTRAVAAATESEETPEKTAAEADASEVGGRGGRGPGGHGARRGGDPREVPRGPAQRARGRREAGRVLPAQRGAGLGLERGERDQGVAEAAVRVGEAEEVVQQALRERGRAEAAQRVLRLRVVQQAGERREHAAQPRRGLGHGLRGGPRRQAAHQRPQVGDVVVELEHQRVEPARQARRPRAVGDGLVVGGAGARAGPGRGERDRAAESDHHPDPLHTSTPALFGSIDYRAMDSGLMGGW